MIEEFAMGTVGHHEIMGIALMNQKGTIVTLMNLGAAINKIMVAAKNGTMKDICLGYDKPEDYAEHDGFFGACVGRCANRIARGRFNLNGIEYQLTINDGKNHLHGGTAGFDKKVWDYVIEGETVKFSCLSGDMEQGYPGNLRAEVSYRLEEDNSLVIEYFAETDKDTVVNLTNHNYYNLGGHMSGQIYDHIFQINADKYTLSDDELIPTGEFADVAGTVLDFRTPTPIGTHIKDASISAYGGYDHNYVIRGDDMRRAAFVKSPKTGITMEVLTDIEGIQLYSGNFISNRIGKNGAEYDKQCGFCLELQHFPDAINHPEFPSPILRKGGKYHYTAIYRFGVEE